jgi:hypothetical protein
MAVIDERIPKDYIDKNGKYRKGVVRIYSEEDRKKIEHGDVVFDLIRLNKEIKNYLNDLEEYGLDLGLLEEDELMKFRTIMALVLFHHALDFFGGLPTGFINAHLKDYTTIEIFSSYGMRNKIPNVTFDGVEKPFKKQPARFLKIFHGYNREKEDLFDAIKKSHCQIPDYSYTVPLKLIRGANVEV